MDHRHLVQLTQDEAREIGLGLPEKPLNVLVPLGDGTNALYAGYAFFESFLTRGDFLIKDDPDAKYVVVVHYEDHIRLREHPDDDVLGLAELNVSFHTLGLRPPMGNHYFPWARGRVVQPPAPT